MNKDLETYFAPAERKTLSETESEMKVILSAINMQELLNVLPYVVLILNKERQIVCSA